MPEISIEQLKNEPEKFIQASIIDGDIIPIDTGKGKTVLMEKSEYEMLRQALEMLIVTEGTK
jgi:hypothetical protein